jgi:hypothetical protein
MAFTASAQDMDVAHDWTFHIGFGRYGIVEFYPTGNPKSQHWTNIHFGEWVCPVGGRAIDVLAPVWMPLGGVGAFMLLRRGLKGRSRHPPPRL